MIKTIVFDLGGVYFTRGTKIAAQRIFRLKTLSKEKKKKIDNFFKGKERISYGKGKIIKREFWELAVKKLKINKKQIEKLREIWHSSYKPNAGMKNLVQKLRKNYRVIVFSGNIKGRVDYLNKKYGLYDNFDDFVLSFDFGLTKRDIKFYKILLKKIKSKPGECVCIDDSERVLALEKSFGMKTILFKNAKQVKTDLRKLGVKI